MLEMQEIEPLNVELMISCSDSWKPKNWEDWFIHAFIIPAISDNG